MEVRHGQEFCLALGEPFSGGAALALGAVTIATRIISDVDVCALIAERDVSAESRRTATLNGRHHLQLLEAHVTGVGLTPSGPMIAEDIRDLQSWTGHPRALRGRLVSCGAQRC